MCSGPCLHQKASAAQGKQNVEGREQACPLDVIKVGCTFAQQTAVSFQQSLAHGGEDCKMTSLCGECGAWGWVKHQDWTKAIHSTLNPVQRRHMLSIKMLHKRSCKQVYEIQSVRDETEENAPFCSVIMVSAESSSCPRPVTTWDSPTTRAAYRQSL